MEMLKTVPRYAVSRVKTRKELTGSDDEDEVRFSAEATWSVDATVNFGSTASLRLGVELLLRLTNTLPCNVPPDACHAISQHQNRKYTANKHYTHMSEWVSV